MNDSLHPVARLLPEMSAAEFAQFRESIRTSGQREPVTLHRDGRIIDGRHRARACRELGLPLATRIFEGQDPELLSYVLDLNLTRRHLDESQRAIVAARAETLRHGGNRQGANVRLGPDREALAKTFGISERTICSARAVLKHGAPELVEAVEQGDIAVSAAAQLARRPRKQQLARIERDRRKAAGCWRQPDDFYRTPRGTTRALLGVEQFPTTVWGPAAGDGAISRVFEEAGHSVVSTDLVDRDYGEAGRDFLQEPALLAECIVTNPPFKPIDEFAVHALELGVEKMAILARLAWLEGRTRHQELWRREKLARIGVFSERQTLWRGDDAAPEADGGMTAYAWFIFERNHRGLYAGGWL